MSMQDSSPSSILYKNRILFLFGEINEDLVSNIVPHLLILDSLGVDPIKLYINSPGGSITAGMAIYDTMRFIKAPVYTICIGMAASMACWLLAAGSPGHRITSENSQIMIHQGHTLIHGTYADLKIDMKEFERTHEKLIRILANHTGKDPAAVNEAIDRDYWMTPQEAVEFGIIDRVVGR